MRPFGIAVCLMTDSFRMSRALGSGKFSLGIEPATSEVKGERTDHCATKAPLYYTVHLNISYVYAYHARHSETRYFLTVLVSFSVFDRFIVLTSVELSGTIMPQI